MNPIPWLLVALLAAVWAGPELVARAFGVRGMSPRTLRRLLASGERGVVVLDVRSDAEFASGHIKGAKHLPLHRLANGLPLLEGLKGTRVVCVCASGKRSAVAAIRLRRAGFSDVSNLWGGMLFWGRKDVVRN